MFRALRWYDYITINIFFFALTALSQTNGLVFPLLTQQFVGEEVKGPYLGRLRLGTLMVALPWQELMGMLWLKFSKTAVLLDQRYPKLG